MTTFKRYNGTNWEYVGLPNNVGMSPQTLAFAQVTTVQSGITGAVTDLTGLSVTVVVPEGRRIRISGHGGISRTVADGQSILAIREGSTILDHGVLSPNAASRDDTVETVAIITPTAGSHTYKLSMQTLTGTGTSELRTNANFPAFILVEDITGSTLPYSPSSTPVGTLAFAQRFSNQTGIGTTPVLIGGLSVNVSVPAGRQLKITGFLPTFTKTSGVPTWVRAYIRRDGVDIQRTIESNTNDVFTALTAEVIDSPTAGAHIYEIFVDTDTGTLALDLGSIGAGANAFIMVQDVTPTPAAGTGAPGSTLGYAEVTASQSGITAETDLTGLAVTVTVPAGRRIRIAAKIAANGSAASSTPAINIKEGATALQNIQIQNSLTAGNGTTLEGDVIITPTAGTHTYKLTLQLAAGSGTVGMVAASTFPAYILVEDITGAVWPTGSQVTSGLIASEAWTTYVPTFTNLTVGAGTLEAAYMRLGRTIHYRIKWVFGAGSAVSGSVTYTLPVTPHATYTQFYPMSSDVRYLDSGSTVYLGTSEFNSGLTVTLLSSTDGGAAPIGRGALSSTNPMTWATGDTIYVTGTYEAAS